MRRVGSRSYRDGGSGDRYLIQLLKLNYFKLHFALGRLPAGPGGCRSDPRCGMSSHGGSGWKSLGPYHPRWLPWAGPDLLDMTDRWDVVVDPRPLRNPDSGLLRYLDDVPVPGQGQLPGVPMMGPSGLLCPRVVQVHSPVVRPDSPPSRSFLLTGSLLPLEGLPQYLTLSPVSRPLPLFQGTFVSLALLM